MSRGYGTDPWPDFDEEEAGVQTRPASLSSGLAETESIAGNRYMTEEGRRDMRHYGIGRPSGITVVDDRAGRR